MKLAVALLTILPLFAQKTVTCTVDSNNKVTCPQLDAQPEKSTVEKASQWVGLGKEVGDAISGGLNATVDVAEKFGKTDVGYFTMGMVAWRVLGKDFIRMFISIPIFFSGMAFLIWSYRKTCCTYRYVSKVDNAAKTKEWAISETMFKDPEDRAIVMACHGGAMLLWCVGLSMFFAG